MTMQERAITIPENWWSSAPFGWAQVADATCVHWQRSQRTKVKLDREVALDAMAFGFGSLAAYGQHRPWSEVEGQLSADWQAAGRETEHPWELVHSAAKAGWTAAGVGFESRSAMATHTHPPERPEEPAPRQVPGGRPDRHNG